MSKSKFEFKYQPSSMDMSPDGRSKASAVANALQEAARHHAKELGWGVESLLARK